MLSIVPDGRVKRGWRGREEELMGWEPLKILSRGDKNRFMPEDWWWLQHAEWLGRSPVGGKERDKGLLSSIPFTSKYALSSQRQHSPRIKTPDWGKRHQA